MEGGLKAVGLPIWENFIRWPSTSLVAIWYQTTFQSRYRTKSKRKIAVGLPIWENFIRWPSTSQVAIWYQTTFQSNYRTKSESHFHVKPNLGWVVVELGFWLLKMKMKLDIDSLSNMWPSKNLAKLELSLVLLSPSLSFVLLVKIRLLQIQINFLSLDKKGKSDNHFQVNTRLDFC